MICNGSAMASRVGDKHLLSATHLAKPLGFVFSFFWTKQNLKDFADFENTPKPLNIALSALFTIAIVGNWLFLFKMYFHPFVSCFKS